MSRKSFNPEKELKKAQKRGMYNSKVRVIAVLSFCLLTVGIVASYALISFTSENVAFDADVNKKVTVNVTINNGTIASPQIETTYNTLTNIAIEPNKGYIYDNLSCSNNQTASYESEKNYLMISPTADTECVVNFKPKGRVLSEVLKQEEVKTDVTQSGMFALADNYGDSYYYKGNVENNYIAFAGHTWRIVRINGDGSIRLVATESIGTTPFSKSTWASGVGFTYSDKPICTFEDACDGSTSKGISAMKAFLDEYYNTNLMDFDNQIVQATYCNDTLVTEETEEETTYNASSRFAEKNFMLSCADTQSSYGGVYKLKIGLLSMDEVELAKIYTEDGVLSYLDMSKPWWTMTPSSLKTLYTNDSNNFATMDSELDVYPVINLDRAVITTGGDGTVENPYVVE